MSARASATAAPPATGIAVREVGDISDLDALAPEWLALWRGVDRATAFQSPHWQIAWWRAFGAEAGGLRALVFRRAGVLVGVAPLFARADDSTGRIRLLLAGTGNTDRLDPLFLPGWERACARAMLEHLAATRARWDDCDFQQLTAGSPLLCARPPGDITAARRQGEPCPVLTLAGIGLPDDRRVLPSGAPMWERLAYYRRRAARVGRLEVESANAGNVHALLGILFEMHGARWRERGEEGGLSDPAVRAFHRLAAPLLLVEGALRLAVLRLDGRPIAGFLGFANREWVSYYAGAFEPGVRQLSPGTLMVGEAIENAARSGAREFDFLRGREPYKYRWGAADQPTGRLLLRPRAHRARGAPR